jgi:hypothetical protein
MYKAGDDAGRLTRLQAVVDGQLVWINLVTEALVGATLRLLPAILEGTCGRPAVEPRRDLVHV